jgi:hypothetical protein
VFGQGGDRRGGLVLQGLSPQFEADAVALYQSRAGATIRSVAVDPGIKNCGRSAVSPPSCGYRVPPAIPRPTASRQPLRHHEFNLSRSATTCSSNRISSTREYCDSRPIRVSPGPGNASRTENPHPGDFDLLAHELYESNWMWQHGNQNYRRAHQATLDAGHTWDEHAPGADGIGFR